MEKLSEQDVYIKLITPTLVAANLRQTLSKPLLNRADKAIRNQFVVPTVPLFVHERRSTKAIFGGNKTRKAKDSTWVLFDEICLTIASPRLRGRSERADESVTGRKAPK